MKPTVIITFAGASPYERAVLATLDAVVVHTPDFTHPDAIAAMPEADAIIVTLQRVDDALLARLPKCKIVSRLGVGYDTIDVAAATRRGIWVGYQPDYGMDEVSAHAIALLMACMRGIPKLNADTKAGVWGAGGVPPVKRLSNSTTGVIGFGRIGREAAAKARGLGMRVVVHDPVVPADVIIAAGCEAMSLQQALSESDYVTLHTPLSDHTRNLINAQTLSWMKPTAYLINTARGGLIDEAALLDALDRGVIRGAGLDVFVQEPAPADHPLISHPHVIATPHFASYSEEAQHALHTRGAEDVVRVLSGGKPRMPLNDVSGRA